MELHPHPLKAAIWPVVLGKGMEGLGRRKLIPVPRLTHNSQTHSLGKTDRVEPGTPGADAKWAAPPSLPTNKDTHSTSFGQEMSFGMSQGMCRARILQLGSTTAAAKGAASSPGLASSWLS